MSGINVTLDADGVRVRTESLAALLAGGVAFDVPEFLTHGKPAAGQQRSSRCIATGASR